MTSEPTTIPAATVEPVVQEVRIEAPPERVFPFLVEPGLMTRWFGREATLDARPGGIFHVDVDGAHVAAGEFVTVEPPRRVVFTFGWEDPAEAVQAGQSTVEITLLPDGGGTLLGLEHRDLPNEEERTGHAEGWSYFLSKLPEAVATA
jgi:uncharacterized protein YndB with AHSA1/START domain